MNILRNIAILAVGLLTSVGALAQNSLPAPGGVAGGPGHGGPGGWGGNSMPAPGGVAGGSWGSPWQSSWGYAPASHWNWQNSGYANVMACGYDAQGVWRVIPLKVAYSYNGLQYNVTVVNAWNPWSDMWNYNVDQPAYNTSYFINGNNYNFYTPLSTGTYYFNL